MKEWNSAFYNFIDLNECDVGKKEYHEAMEFFYL
jgi:hypothetical protein